MKHLGDTHLAAIPRAKPVSPGSCHPAPEQHSVIRVTHAAHISDFSVARAAQEGY